MDFTLSDEQHALRDAVRGLLGKHYASIGARRTATASDPGFDEQVWAELRMLRAMGVRIAIDDFGTGYSSLSYLRQMPVDVMKLDKSFIDDIVQSRQQHALVEAIVTLAENLNLAVVAEGIEQPDQRTALSAMGCPYGQGYLFARPQWPADIPALTRAAAEPVESAR